MFSGKHQHKIHLPSCLLLLSDHEKPDSRDTDLVRRSQGKKDERDAKGAESGRDKGRSHGTEGGGAMEM